MWERELWESEEDSRVGERRESEKDQNELHTCMELSKDKFNLKNCKCFFPKMRRLQCYLSSWHSQGMCSIGLTTLGVRRKPAIPVTMRPGME